MVFTIAVSQFKISHQNPDLNFSRMEGFVIKAKKQKAKVIVFPEDCVTGSIFGNREWLDSTGKYRRRFQDLARKYEIDIVTGSCMESTAGGAFNTSYYINAAGEVLGEYRKNHLYLSERSFLTPGTEIAVFDTAYGRAGLVICWDILYPEIFERMARAGVQIVYCPSYWYDEISGAASGLNSRAEREQIDALCVARALENNIVLVYANAAGVMNYPQGGRDTLIGHSQIAVPFLGAVKKCRSNREAMFVESIDLSILELAKKVYQLRV